MGSYRTHMPIRSRDPWLHPGYDSYESLAFHSRFRGASPSGGSGCRETKSHLKYRQPVCGICFD
ncbi:rCG50776 [Rattus norvegicus]|uniref:RCG50776 n=1 Tax=Rattus norvegicus TaxID=10116 RepID=A6KCH7_RAT|nr:rCG50776 [Rattus norvegicus]